MSARVSLLGVDKAGELNRNGSVYRSVCKGTDMYRYCTMLFVIVFNFNFLQLSIIF